ncbi:uncharacterized protein ARMOST_02808 [Armillaria ostoyae]|uniref:Uncharacterized protein n=1 Tax=Armillaria ostoyae TaxID=47428 RepID=A0A284QSP1_ARMOS|nr:uncharacterized protein ARMOST_02808 [Armillaria ostoyae]
MIASTGSTVKGPRTSVLAGRRRVHGRTGFMVACRVRIRFLFDLDFGTFFVSHSVLCLHLTFLTRTRVFSCTNSAYLVPSTHTPSFGVAFPRARCTRRQPLRTVDCWHEEFQGGEHLVETEGNICWSLRKTQDFWPLFAFKISLRPSSLSCPLSFILSQRPQLCRRRSDYRVRLGEDVDRSIPRSDLGALFLRNHARPERPSDAFAAPQTMIKEDGDDNLEYCGWSRMGGTYLVSGEWWMGREVQTQHGFPG